MVSDKTRREAFITQNLGLVHACAGRFRGRGMEYDDLYSAGCVPAPGGSADGASNTMTFTVRAVWG